MKYLLKQNSKNNLVIINARGEEERINVNHTNDTIQELKEDVYNTFLVCELVTNFARLHLISAASKDEALQEVHNHILEEGQEEEEEGITLSVNELIY